MEYAYLLWMKRRWAIRDRKQIKSETNKYVKNTSTSKEPKSLDQLAEVYSSYGANYTPELTAYCYKIDSMSQIVSLALIALFNAVYWAAYY